MDKLPAVTSAIAYIEGHLQEPLNLELVAEAAHYSKYHLHRLFADTVGITIHDYMRRRRLTEAAKLLVFSDRPILDIALGAGYLSQQAFADVFRDMYKKSPRRFREGGAYYPLQLEFRFDGERRPDRRGAPPPREIAYATQDDIPAWMDLVRLVIDGFPHLREEEHLRALRQSIDRRGALIMREGEAAVGTVMLCRATGSIDFLGVHPLRRRQGVAGALVRRVFDELLEHRDIHITTFRQGDRADTGHRAALRELGFAEAELLTEFGYPTQRMTILNGGGRSDE